MASETNARDEEKFAALLREVRAGMPDAASADQLETGFRKHWARPPLEELELLLQRTTSLRDARLLLFFPEPVDMLRYVALAQRAPAGAPADHPQNKVRVPFLALLYMRHVRNWPLMRTFILEGGLRVLADNFADDNIYLRAQAIDVMMQLTSTELHDWFATPTLEPAVHRRWLDLAAPEASFVKHIEINLADSFPGGSHYCLQILAFWLSLLRYFYCEQRVLRLGTHLMEMLKKWAAAEKPQDELELASRLVEDFGRFPTVDGMHGQLIGVAGTGGATPSSGELPVGAEAEAEPQVMAPVDVTPAIVEVERGGDAGASSSAEPSLLLQSGENAAKEKPTLPPAAAPAPAPAPAPATSAPASQPRTAPAAAPRPASVQMGGAKSAAELKAAGNAAFGAGRLQEAVRLYSAALEGAKTDRHLIFSNRCAAYLKLATVAAPTPAAAPENAAPEAAAAAAAAAPAAAPGSAAYWAELAAADARECTRLAPSFAKGHYRLGTALLQLGRAADAVGALEEGLVAAPLNDELREALRTARAEQEKARRAKLVADKQAAASAGGGGGGGAHDAAGGGGGGAPKKAHRVDYEKAAATAARAHELAEERRLSAAAAQAAAQASGSAPAGAGAATATATATATGGGGGGAEASGEVPQSAQQFERMWAALRREPLQARRAFLARLPEASYAAVFGQSLAEPTLVSILEALEAIAQGDGGDGGNGDGGVDEPTAPLLLQALGGLASTRRFEMMLMFLDKPQLARVGRLFGVLRAAKAEVPPALASAWGQK